MDESVLLRRVGGPKVMHEQLSHLRELIEGEKVSLRVLPLEAGAHPGMVSSFTYIHFADARDPDCTYLEGLVGDTFVEGEDPVAGYRDAFEAIRATAVDAVTSLRMVKQAIRANATAVK